MRRILPFLLFAVAAFAADLELIEPQPLIVDQNGNASANLTLRNNTASDIPLSRLVLTDFQHRRGSTNYPLGALTTWSSAPDKVPAKGSATLKLSVSRIWEAGASTAVLRNGDQAIPLVDPSSGQIRQPEAVLTVVRIPGAYNIQIVSSTPDAPEIHFIGSRALVGLKNTDPFNYRFRWRLRSGDQQVQGGTFELPGNSTQYLELSPATASDEFRKSQASFPSAGLLTAGTLKDEVVKGSLLLEPDFGPDSHQPVPAKELPATLRFSFWPENTQEIVNAIFVFVLLGVGGTLSILVNYGIPNTRRALALSRRTRELEKKIKGIGSSIGSHWRVLLESHLPAIQNVLSSGIWILPSFSTKLDELTKEIEIGQQWVEITYDASLILHQAGQTPELFSPTVLLCLQERCARALTPMESGFTKPEEIEGMRADLKVAQRCLDVTLAKAPHPELEKEIQEREARVCKQFDELAGRYPRFSGMILQAKAAAGQSLVQANYVNRDTLSLKMELLRAYDERLQQLPEAAVAAAVGSMVTTGSDCPAAVRLHKHGDRLAEYLVADTHESLRLAGLFVNEMRQDIFADADGTLMAALKSTPPAVSIVHDPCDIQVNTPVRFALQFDRQILNEAVARLEWRCTWDFGDGRPPESGWEVFHVFTEPGEPVVKVALQDLQANPIAPAPPERKIQVKPADSAVAWFRPENNIEVLRLTMVLVLALFGLMAAARQQAENLSFLQAVCGVIALGFGADTLKNLVLRSSSDSN